MKDGGEKTGWKGGFPSELEVKVRYVTLECPDQVGMSTPLGSVPTLKSVVEVTTPSSRPPAVFSQDREGAPRTAREQKLL